MAEYCKECGRKLNFFTKAREDTCLHCFNEENLARIAEENEESCEFCGAPLPKESNFCLKCGRALTSTKEQKCESCGTSNSAEALFCSFCGEKIVYSASQAQPHLQSQEQALVYDPEAQSSLQASQPSDRELVRYDRQDTQAYESPQPATGGQQRNVNYSYPSSQDNAYERPQQVPVSVFQTDRKNPGVAAVLSFFWAGLGQIYNGQLMKGIGFIVLYAFSVLLCFVLIGFIILPIVWIIGIADAYSTAKAYNERQLQNDRLYYASLRR
jgi:TM2 domain-containing membrane protein YozV